MKSITCALLILFGLGCSRPNEIEGPHSYLIPWPRENGEYRLTPIEIQSFTRPLELRGELAQIFVEPYSTDFGLAGELAVGRYVSSDNIWTPSDFITLQAVTIYAHMEKLYKIDQDLGVAWRSTPRHIGLHAMVDMGGGAPMTNNAFYDGRIDAMVVVPYTDQNLPLSMNAGVLAHEHFHSIFFQQVMMPMIRQLKIEQTNFKLNEILEENKWDGLRRGQCSTENDPLNSQVLYLQILIRGLNEGLADFWGWIYTGDGDFISKSMLEMSTTRKLSSEAERLPTAAEIKDLIDSANCRQSIVSDAYRLGTRFARILYQFVRKNGLAVETQTDRLEVGRSLVQSLSGASKLFITAARALDDHKEGDLLEPEAMLQVFIDGLPARNAESCKFLRSKLINTNQISRCEEFSE